MGNSLGRLIVSILGDNKGLDNTLTDSEKKVKKFGRNMESIGKELSNIGTGLTTYVTAPLALIGFQATKTAAQFEDFEDSLGTLLGSQEKGLQMLSAIEEYSASTNFQMPGLVGTTEKLLGFGVEADKMIYTISRLADASKGNAAVLDRLSSAYGKVKAKGRASLEEINMFTEAGVPVLAELAKMYNVSSEELYSFISSGKVGFEELDEALTNLTTGQGQFAGMVEKQSQNLNGLISTLLDNINLLLKDFGEVFIDDLKSIVSWITELTQSLRTMDDGTKKIIATIAVAAASVGPLLFAFGKIIAISGNVVTGIALIKKALIALNASLMTNPYILIIAAVAALAAGMAILIYRANNVKETLNSLKSANEKLKNLQDEYIETINKLNDASKNLNETERTQLEIQKSKLKLQIYKEIEKITKAYEKLNNKSVFRGNRTQFEAIRDNIDKTNEKIEQYKKLIDEAVKSNQDYIKITTEAGDAYYYTIDQARKMYLKFLQDNEKYKNQLQEANALQKESFLNLANYIETGIITINELKSSLPDDLFYEVFQYGGLYALDMAKNINNGTVTLERMKEVLEGYSGLYDKVINKLNELKNTQTDNTKNSQEEQESQYKKLEKLYQEYIKLKKKYNFEDGKISEEEFNAKLRLDEILKEKNFNSYLELREKEDEGNQYSLEELEKLYTRYTELHNQMNENNFSSYSEYIKAKLELDKLSQDEQLQNFIEYKEKINEEKEKMLIDNKQLSISLSTSFMSSLNSELSSLANFSNNLVSNISSVFINLSNLRNDFVNGFENDADKIKAVANGVHQAVTMIGNTIKDLYATINESNQQEIEYANELRENQFQAELDALDEKLQKELEKKGLADQTEVEMAEEKLQELNEQYKNETDASKKASIQEQINETEKELEKQKILEKYAKEKKKLENKHKMERWKAGKAEFENQKQEQTGMIWIMWAIGTAAALAQGIAQYGPVLGLAFGAAAGLALGITSAIATAKIQQQKYPPPPKLATGGYINKPVIAEIGEGQDAEAVMPLNRKVFAMFAEGIINEFISRASLLTNGSGNYNNNQNSITNQRIVNVNGPISIAPGNYNDFIDEFESIHREKFR